MIFIMTECSYTLQRFTMIEKSLSQIKSQLKRYDCGCGSRFRVANSFKDHLLTVHKTYSYHRSSHFIAKFTQVVLPISKEQLAYLRQNNRTHTKKIKSQLGPAINNDHIETKTRGRKKSQVIITKTSQQLEQIPLDQYEAPQIKGKKSDNHFQWNGFKLVKNSKNSKDSFYCGKCNTTFAEMPQYIIHCIQYCQQLKCSRSSHFIQCMVDSKVKKVNQQRKTSSVNKSKREDIVLPLELYFFRLAKNSLDHRNEIFHCYECNLSMHKPRSYLRHIISHGDIIHNLSSHIIIRVIFNNNKLNVYITSSIPWQDDSIKFYCPCNMDSKMRMQKLIEHIKTVHMGKSPYYIYKKTINDFRQLL